MPSETLIEDERWRSLDLPNLVERALDAVLHSHALEPTAFEISVLGCNDARISALNGSFRGKQTPTNVLSWPSAERSVEQPGAQPFLPDPRVDAELGDIAISYDTCLAEAEASGKTLSQHVTHLLVHGILHLLGYDHENDADAGLMEETEIKILGKLGLPDPY